MGQSWRPQKGTIFLRPFFFLLDDSWFGSDGVAGVEELAAAGSLVVEVSEPDAAAG